MYSIVIAYIKNGFSCNM